MTGHPQFNIPAFAHAAEDMRDMGFNIVVPYELDDPYTKSCLLASSDGSVGSDHTGRTFIDYLARDLKVLADECDGIILLPGWDDSKGARLEAYTALLLGKPIALYSGGVVYWHRERDVAVLLASDLLDKSNGYR